MASSSKNKTNEAKEKMELQYIFMEKVDIEEKMSVENYLLEGGHLVRDFPTAAVVSDHLEGVARATFGGIVSLKEPKTANEKVWALHLQVCKNESLSLVAGNHVYKSARYGAVASPPKGFSPKKMEDFDFVKTLDDLDLRYYGGLRWFLEISSLPYRIYYDGREPEISLTLLEKTADDMELMMARCEAMVGKERKVFIKKNVDALFCIIQTTRGKAEWLPHVPEHPQRIASSELYKMLTTKNNSKEDIEKYVDRSKVEFLKSAEELEKVLFSWDRMIKREKMNAQDKAEAELGIKVAKDILATLRFKKDKDLVQTRFAKALIQNNLDNYEAGIVEVSSRVLERLARKIEVLVQQAMDAFQTKMEKEKQKQKN